MCVPSVDPVSLGVNAAMIGGGALLGMKGAATDQKIAEERRAQKIINDAEMANARNSVTQAYLKRQGALQDENAGVNTAAIDKYSALNQEQGLTDATAHRVAGVDANIAPPAFDVPTAGDDPALVKQDIAAKVLSRVQRATAGAKAMAKVNAYGDLFANNAYGTADATRKVNTTNDFARGETALLPAMQDFASYGAYQPQAPYTGLGGAPYSTIGNILAGMGGKGIGGAFTSAGPSGTTANPSFGVPAGGFGAYR